MDLVISGLAGVQHSVLGRRQLFAAGITRDVIDHRVATRRLHVVMPGVYSVSPKVTQRDGGYPRRRGVATLRGILGDGAFTKVTRSELEDQFLETLVRYGIELPITNTYVEGHECDAVWPRHRLVVELDSRTFHMDPVAFEDDRRRDRVLQRAGWRVVRITKRQLDREEAAVAGDVRGLLSAAAA